MESQTATQKLDAVLSYFASEKSSRVNFSNINEKFGLKDHETRQIVDRLIMDGYIRDFEHSGPLGQEWTTYSITFDGMLFYENGGYAKQQEVNGIDQTNAEARVKVALRNEVLLVRGTWFAGIAAVMLLLWQIFLYFYPVHKDFPYWIWEK